MKSQILTTDLTLPECYRTGLFENPFPELELSVTPGGRFDPLGFAEAGDLEELKVKELKHCLSLIHI